jgi:hypothetical protein
MPDQPEGEGVALRRQVLEELHEGDDIFGRRTRGRGAFPFADGLKAHYRAVVADPSGWPGGRGAFLRHFGQSLGACFARYRGVLHLQSLAESHPHLFGRAGNTIRFEDVEGARAVERAVRAAWEGHPGLKLIPGGQDIRDKVGQVLAHVEAVLATL